jgi:hypothetical protein
MHVEFYLKYNILYDFILQHTTYILLYLRQLVQN